MKIYLRFLVFATLLPFLTVFQSCSEEVQRSMKAIPTAFGQLNEIVIVMDQELWDSPVGDTLRYYYSSAYPLLPQPEPIFDLRHFTPIDLKKDPLRKELRTYMFVGNLSDEDSPAAQMIRKDIGDEMSENARTDQSKNNAAGRDKWAKGQLLLYQFAYSNQDLISILKENYPAIKKKVNKFDEKKLESYVYLNGVNNKLINEVKESMSVSIRMPSDYFMAINDGEVIWMRKETDKISSNIMLRKVNYEDQGQLSKDYLIEMRDSLGKQYISSTIEETYMQVNDVDLPVIYNTTKVNGNYAVEGRGVWEIVNDYMGGSFISYLILNPTTSELLFVDGFLHAPGEDKRDFMEQLDYVMHTVKFN
ncbi:MAG: DUF4837 family protein [Phaeodactylibacter sp.]|nr:DUF4837 family protein [Phaeodactylibacter sp.]